MKKLLIERTSVIEVPKQTLIESIHKNDGRLIIKNVLVQRADAPNKNGRVYPKRVLERSIEEYMSLVRSKMAYGEIDHPACFWPNTEILTKDGWKYIKDIEVGEQVATLNTTNNLMEWQPTNKVINEPYKGKMIRIVGNNINTCVTPNHRFYVQMTHRDAVVVMTAQEILDSKLKRKSIHGYIPTTAGWEGQHFDTWTISANPTYNGTIEARKIQHTDLVLNAEAFFAFLGFYLAEGCTNHHSGSYSIIVSQNEGDRAEQFRKVLSSLSPEITWSETTPSKRKTLNFYITDSRLFKYLEPLGNKYTKFIPDEIKSASKPLLTILFEWFLKGDGANVHGRRSVFTVSRLLIEDLHEILLKTGYAGVIKVQNNHEKDRMIEGRLIKASNSKPLNRLWVKKAKGVYLDFRFLTVDEIEYDGTVHCVNVDNSTIYCKDGIAPFWSGNSEPEANVISMKNVAQAIQDIRWKGNEVYADVEILKTPAGNIIKEILLAGYRVGQSSRGMGSVEPLKETDGEDLVEVQDDFSLLTISDIVSNPSTFYAEMTLSESNNGSNKLIIPESNPTKVDMLIQDILCEISNLCCIHKK